MSAVPDILVDGECNAEVANEVVDDPGKSLSWIVRLEKRDAECQFRYVDRNGNINSRLSSAMRMSREDAVQFAMAITERHPKFKAKAMVFATSKA